MVTGRFFVRMKQTAKVKTLFDKPDSTETGNSCYETKCILRVKEHSEEGRRQKERAEVT